MVWQCTRKLFLIGVVVASLAVSARADDGCCAPAAPCMRTICERVCTPETYTATRTVYDRVCTEEKYTAYRCECVPEQRTRTVCVMKQVSELQTVKCTVWDCVPTVETRTTYQQCVSYVPVTTVTRKCVDKGHYECREVPCQPSLMSRIKKHCNKGCCDDCCPPPTKTVKCWVPCPVWEEIPCTKMQRVCESKPVTCQVTVMKKVAREVERQVTVCKCVPEQRTETCTVMVTRKVPVEATRTVVKCVPRLETYTCTRNVWKTVERQVPVETCCQTSCCSTSCCGKAKHSFFRSSGLHARQSCNSCCN